MQTGSQFQCLETGCTMAIVTIKIFSHMIILVLIATVSYIIDASFKGQHQAQWQSTQKQIAKFWYLYSESCLQIARLATLPN